MLSSGRQLQRHAKWVNIYSFGVWPCSSWSKPHGNIVLPNFCSSEIYHPEVLKGVCPISYKDFNLLLFMVILRAVVPNLYTKIKESPALLFPYNKGADTSLMEALSGFQTFLTGSSLSWPSGSLAAAPH